MIRSKKKYQALCLITEMQRLVAETQLDFVVSDGDLTVLDGSLRDIERAVTSLRALSTAPPRALQGRRPQPTSDRS